jgi:hypothetical protein
MCKSDEINLPRNEVVDFAILDREIIIMIDSGSISRRISYYSLLAVGNAPMQRRQKKPGGYADGLR